MSTCERSGEQIISSLFVAVPDKAPENCLSGPCSYPNCAEGLIMSTKYTTLKYISCLYAMKNCWSGFKAPPYANSIKLILLYNILPCIISFLPKL